MFTATSICSSFPLTILAPLFFSLTVLGEFSLPHWAYLRPNISLRSDRPLHFSIPKVVPHDKEGGVWLPVQDTS